MSGPAPSLPRTEPLTGVGASAGVISGGPFSVRVLLRGFSEAVPGGGVRAEGSVSLVRGLPRGPVLVDTGGPWGAEALRGRLSEERLRPSEVALVLVTHGHSDHAGALALFPGAELILGTERCLPGGLYPPCPLARGLPLPLHEALEVLPTPGHTRACVSLLVRGTDRGHVLLAGDLFERLGDEGAWQTLSEDVHTQATSRARALQIADVVVPGHGAPFRVCRDAQ